MAANRHQDSCNGEQNPPSECNFLHCDWTASQEKWGFDTQARGGHRQCGDEVLSAQLYFERGAGRAPQGAVLAQIRARCPESVSPSGLVLATHKHFRPTVWHSQYSTVSAPWSGDRRDRSGKRPAKGSLEELPGAVLWPWQPSAIQYAGAGPGPVGSSHDPPVARATGLTTSHLYRDALVSLPFP